MKEIRRKTSEELAKWPTEGGILPSRPHRHTHASRGGDGGNTTLQETPVHILPPKPWKPAKEGRNGWRRV